MKLETKRTEINRVTMISTIMGDNNITIYYFPELTSYQVVINDEEDGLITKASTDFNGAWAICYKYLEAMLGKIKAAALKVAATPNTPGSGDFS